MTDKPPILNIDSVETAPVGNGETFAAAVSRLGQQLGMTQMGCSLVELEPGKRAWPYHLHYGQEEFFVMLEGEGTLRYDDQEYPIRSGDVFFAGTGEGTAHQIINTSDKPMRYLALSTMHCPEVCFYPDSKKYGSYAWDESGVKAAFLARKDSAVDYFEGE